MKKALAVFLSLLMLFGGYTPQAVLAAELTTTPTGPVATKSLGDDSGTSQSQSNSQNNIQQSTNLNSSPLSVPKDPPTEVYKFLGIQPGEGIEIDKAIEKAKAIGLAAGSEKGDSNYNAAVDFDGDDDVDGVDILTYGDILDREFASNLDPDDPVKISDNFTASDATELLVTANNSVGIQNGDANWYAGTRVDGYYIGGIAFDFNADNVIDQADLTLLENAIEAKLEGDPNQGPAFKANQLLLAQGNLNALNAYEVYLTLREKIGETTPAVLDAYDLNGDGAISEADSDVLLLAASQLLEEQEVATLNAIFAFVNQEDGTIDPSYFVALSVVRDNQGSPDFAQYDFNGNGVIDSVDLNAIEGVEPLFDLPNLANLKVFNRYDSDGSGVIDAAERTALEQILANIQSTLDNPPYSSPNGDVIFSHVDFGDVAWFQLEGQLYDFNGDSRLGVEDLEHPALKQFLTPLVVGLDAKTNEDQVLEGTLPKGFDFNGDKLTYVLVDKPQNGTVVVNADGTYKYTPSPNASGSERFTFAVTDGEFTSASATVNVSIIAVNDAPTAANIQVDYEEKSEDGTLTVQLLGEDVDQDALSYQLIDPLPAGLTLDTSTGKVTFQPAFGSPETVTFSYKVTDAKGLASELATVTITNVKVENPLEGLLAEKRAALKEKLSEFQKVVDQIKKDEAYLKGLKQNHPIRKLRSTLKRLVRSYEKTMARILKAYDQSASQLRAKVEEGENVLKDDGTITDKAFNKDQARIQRAVSLGVAAGNIYRYTSEKFIYSTRSSNGKYRIARFLAKLSKRLLQFSHRSARTRRR